MNCAVIVSRVSVLFTSAQGLSIVSCFPVLLKTVLGNECSLRLGDLVLRLQLLFITLSISSVQLLAKTLLEFILVFPKIMIAT